MGLFNSEDVTITQEQLDVFKSRGYNDDLLPKMSNNKTTSAVNYFTLWMGSIHNIPNYAAVGGFLFLGLSPINVMLALVISSVIVSCFMVINGLAGSKYGIPFAMHLRSTYGNIGAKLPGFLRGCVAAIAWFGLQTFTGSLALTVLIGKLFPGFLTLGGDASFFGISIPGLITFTVFWILNVAIGLGGGSILNKFTAILSPLIYIVIIGMAIWAITINGGIAPILNYGAEVNSGVQVNTLFVFFTIFNSVIAVWAAPGASIADFTQTATSTKAQAIGQTLSLVVGYTVFAFSSVIILLGGSLHFGVQEWDIVHLIDRWDSLPAVVLATSVFLLTTISTNATGNIIPAGYQLSALFPKKINYKAGVVIASIISFLIMPWKLMENSTSIYLFLNTIGAVLGPVAGVMIASYFAIHKQTLDLDKLYMSPDKDNHDNPYYGVNVKAYIATIAALVISMLGQFIPALAFLSNVSWFVGFISAALIYLALEHIHTK